MLPSPVQLISLDN